MFPDGSGEFLRLPDDARPAVLVVEDDPDDASLLAKVLDDAGMEMVRVARLEQAVAVLRQRSFDFVISDLGLPDAIGVDAVKGLQALTGSAAIIVLTGAEDENVALRAIQAGAQDYLVKGSLDRSLLRRTLRHARERKQLLTQLTHLSRHDGLTGAVNRVALREHIEAALNRARRRDTKFAVMCIDLDHFKAVNDTLGPDVGDSVLREIVSRLRRVVRSSDVVARLGGDEFAVLIDEFTSHADLFDIAQRILKSIEQPIGVAGHPAVVTGSIGIACYPEVSASADEILKAADAAMYHAQRLGRNMVQLAGGMSDEQRARARLASDLQHALERREFVLHFQPQFAIDGQRLVGFEALLRWQRPTAGAGGRPSPGERRLVPPSEFIPLLEDSGRIIAVGEWVIERACQQLAEWREVGHSDIRVGVNLSARQFEGAGLVDWTRRCLERFEIEPHCLELEITETSLMANTRRTVAILHELRGLGVRLAIDDFGTGFSSLAYLNQFSVDCLKIDRSFVEQVHPRGDGEAIARAIISLGHHLGLEVVAEGVETEEQLRCLTNAKCDLIQGFLLGRPGPAHSFEGSDIWSPGGAVPSSTVRMRPLRLPR